MTTITALNSNFNTVTAYTPYDVNTAFPTYEGANRLERAIAILQKPKNIKKVGKDTFTVKSQFSYGTYVVTKNNDEWKEVVLDDISKEYKSLNFINQFKSFVLEIGISDKKIFFFVFF